LHIRSEVVLLAEIQHLLRLRNTANQGTGKLPPFEDQAEDLHSQRLLRSANLYESSVKPQQVQVGIDVVLRGDCVQDEIKAVELLVHLLLVLGDNHFICAQALCIFLLPGRGGEQDHVSTQSVRELHSHVSEAAQADDPNFLPFADLPVLQ